MNVLFKWIDQITFILPPAALTGVRVGALLLWLGLAFVMGMSAWEEGEEDAYQTLDRRQNLEQIEEQLARERNLRRAPHVTLPELEDLPREYDRNNRQKPYTEEGTSGLPQPRLPRLHSQNRFPPSMDREGTFHSSDRREGLVPYLGERPPNRALYREGGSSYLPQTISGAGGHRNKRSSDSLPLLSPDAGLERKPNKNSEANFEAKRDIRDSLQNRASNSDSIEDVSTLPLPPKP